MRVSSSNSGSQIIGSVAGGLCSLLGATVLFGWYTHNLNLLQVRPGLVAMAYNTALCFFLSGAGLLGLLFRRSRLSLFAGGIVLLIGLLTLSEYVIGWDVGIDELLMRSYVRAGITHYSRMAFNTALCFSLTGASLLLQCRNRPSSSRLSIATTTALLGATIIGLGMIAFGGYFAGITSAYAWGAFTRMALHTSLGFMVLGIGLVAAAGCRDDQTTTEYPLRRWLSPFIAIGAATATLCLWQFLIVERSAQLAWVDLQGQHSRPPETLLRMQTAIPTFALGIGLLLAGLLAGAVYLAQEAQQNAKRAEAARSALRQAHDELEQRVEERTSALAQEMADRLEAQEALRLSDERHHTFIREVLNTVTEGRLRLCDTQEELPTPWQQRGEDVTLTAQSLAMIRRLVREAAAEQLFDRERAQDLMTAVSEAAMNAVVHGSGGSGCLCVSPTGALQIWIRDRGEGIRMDSLHRATLERGYTTAGSMGYGFWLMLKTTDRLWLLTGPSGTTVVMEQDRNPHEEIPLPLWLSAKS